ncbi:MAG TPA: glutamine synthetase family protein [Solirubrobacteraceae bacterium]|nr:glutamine synthetase family protein [Solirubrobacteraceae bacterium]
MSDDDLVALVCCDLGAIVRGRSLPSAALESLGRGRDAGVGPGERAGVDRAHEEAGAGVGWVPANHALTPIGTLAEPNPFGSTGDLRLLPDLRTRARVEGGDGVDALELVICDIAEVDGRPWECCPRAFLREALEQLESELGMRLLASFEHEFQLLVDEAPALPFSLEAQRRAGRFPQRAMRALVQAGTQPQRFMPEYASHQFEIPVAAAEGLAAADRALVVREVVREVARRELHRATFTPLLDPAQAGNGVHIHLSLLGADGSSALYDRSRPGSLSVLGGSFAAGILRHAPALTALTAPSPVSSARLAPHHWGAGAACLGLQNRETLLRIPPLVAGAGELGRQLRLEYRGADAAANPYLALGAILRAGLAGVRDGLEPAPLLERDPAQLDAAEAERFGVDGLPGSLAAALAALAADETARGWMTPLMYDAYVAVKGSELEAAENVEVAELCARYAQIH